jgi:phosphosulfolactate phosphohydrolase-like enzyme
MQMMEAQQAKMASQTDLLASVVDATRDLKSLETALNENLASLSASGHFEEVLATLAASTQLLATRVGASSPRAVDLSESPQSGQAA